MKKHFLRMCSMLLIIVMLVNMLPMSVFAEEFRQSLSDVAQSVDPTQVAVVDEIVENRTEFSKEFLLSSGLHMAVVYPEAVHFETENGWEDIDNTLVAKADGTLTNTAGVWDVTFPQTLDESESVTIEKDGYTLSFSMAGELNSTGAMLMTAAMDDRVQPMALAEANPSEVQQKEADISSLKEAAEYPETVPEKLQSGVTYNEVYEDTHITYDLDSNKVKESVILETYKDTLQGYRYTMNVGEMIPVLEEDGQIILYDKTKENIVMMMPAPFLQDHAGEYNNDIQVLLEGSGSEYTMTYLLPTQWLAEETRAWPVILDPVVTPTLTTTNIRDITVFENESYWSPNTTKLTQSWGMLQVGYYSTEGKTRTYLKYKNLPELTSSDVVVSASVHLYNADVENTGQMQTNVHKVNGAWESDSITWANKPGYDTNIEDYALVNDEAGWYSWIITDIVRGWYADGNTGMLFKASDSVEAAAATKYKQFYSSDYSDYNGSKPVLYIQFRNNNGLEGYWDYTASSAGRAGTGYVNHFTGNMVWTRTDMGFGGNRAPVTISHVYNLNDISDPDGNGNNSNNSGGNGFGMGIGWRTNFNQLVYRWNLDSSYYIWEDSDGTDHYFKQENSVYKDEDGLELTLTDTGSGTKKYCIEDKEGNRTYFDTEGRLSLIENNQATKSSITVSYGSGKQISTVTDGAGHVYAFAYSNGLLSRISYRGTGSAEITYVSFGYSNNRLTTVTDADGKSSTYTYDGNSLMRTASDIDGYKLSYGYNTVSEAWQPYRVLSVEESYNTTAGGKMIFEYGHNQTVITDHNNNVEIFQFNDFGNTVSIQDDEGRATFAQYARTHKDDTAGKGNQLKTASKLQNTVGNLIKDSGFEATGSLNSWSVNISTGKLSRITDVTYMGCAAMKADYTAVTGDVYALGPKFQLQPGETCTFSAYVKTVGMEVSMGLTNATTWSTKPGGKIGEEGVNQDWTRAQMTYTNTTSAAIFFRPSFCGGTKGVFYVDCIQIEKAITASRYNLISNGDFDYSGAPAYGWSTDYFTSADCLVTDTPAAPELSNSVLKVTGSPTNLKHIYQHIEVGGEAGDTYVLAGWAKGDSAPLNSDDANDRQFSLTALFFNNDGSRTLREVSFNPDTDSQNRWQYAAGAVIADKPYYRISVDCKYDYNVNTVYFDGIQLYKEEFGNSYTYDDKGNVVSVKDLQAQTTTYEYDSASNMTKIIQNNKAKMTYTYDSYHNVKTATTDEGLKYDFVYDTYGNNTKVSTTTGGVTMESSAAYTSNGNYLASTTDALGKVTTYGYNLQTGVLEWVQYPEDTEDTRTEYTYDSMYRMATAACTTDTGASLSASYTYSDDRLTAIATPTTTYNFTYGDFDLRTGVSIGSRTLATYHYTDDRNNYLSSLDYGNGDKVQYTYDDKGRMTGQSYEDGDTVAYTYDNSGALATVKDSATGITTTNYYDLTDRLMKYVEKGSGYNHSVAYEYDTLNNLKKLTETVNGVVHTTTYDYDDDNRVISSTTDGVTVTYTYDGFGRVATQTTKNGSTTVLTESYTYTAPTEGATSAQVATYTTATPNGYSVTYSYTYDDNGKITGATKVTDGTYTDSYVYDSANQLIREDNQALGYSYAWDYDDAGNITQRRGYDYTDGALDNPIEFADYTYGNSDWGDLLTSYGGKNLTYDEIGNPLTDGTWTYTWEHGRQLASMSKGNTTWNYTYNADGLRTKRTDGTNTYTYIYNGSKLMQLKKGSDTLDFAYDAGGTPLTVTYNGTVYYYVTNLQGDITAILDASGTAVVKYIYDAWGTTWLYSGTMSSTLGALNPLRYRGYVYDSETGLYYLQSRYYDPEIGRFVNADGQLSGVGGDFLGYNMFAYCFNNPVNMDDSSGNWPKWLSGVMNIASGFAQAAAGAVLGATVGWTGFGAVAAAALVLNGAVTAAQGVGQIVNDVTNSNIMREDNIIRTGFQAVGDVIAGDTGAAVAGMVYDIGVVAATIYAPTVQTSPTITPTTTTTAISGACFVAGTKVLTATGYVNIENIHEGELVFAENPDTKEKAIKEVVQVFVRETNELVHVHVNGEEIITTPEHPFFVCGQGWVSAANLHAGDILVMQSGDSAVIQMVQFELLETPVTVYNFEVADFHTYYVGSSAILVHNSCEKMGGQKGNAPWSNQAQNKQFKSIVNKFKLTKDQARELHEAITGQGYSWDEIIDELISLFPEKG